MRVEGSKYRRKCAASTSSGEPKSAHIATMSACRCLSDRNRSFTCPCTPHFLDTIDSYSPACVRACVRAHPRSPSTLAGRANAMIPTMPRSAPGYVLHWARPAGWAAVALGLDGMPRIAPSQASRRPAALRSHFRTGGFGACLHVFYVLGKAYRPNHEGDRTEGGTAVHSPHSTTRTTETHSAPSAKHSDNTIATTEFPDDSNFPCACE